MSKELTPIKISVINTIYNVVKPVSYKLRELVNHAIKSGQHFADVELAALFEYFACSITLVSTFEQYLDLAEEHQVEVIEIPQREFTEIVTMAKVLELAQKMEILNTTLTEH
jgi:hypothetical protein